VRNTDADIYQFQYIALIRYCQNTYATRKQLQEAVAAAEGKLASMQDHASGERARVLSLQQENEQLRTKMQQFDTMKAEIGRLEDLKREVEQYRRLNVNPRDLETFTTNKAAIRHYLKLVPTLIEYAPT
jgi:CHASE3 domain sensor protein